MQLVKINNQSFKGYDARPLKALYMQSGASDVQKKVFTEMVDIGKSEGFDVFMHEEGKIIDNPEDYKVQKHGSYSYWAQDNKFLLKKDGKTTILYPSMCPHCEKKEPVQLGTLKNIKTTPSEIVLEGGNTYLGKKDNGDNYLILGYDTLETTAVKEYLKAEGVEDLDDRTLNIFLEKGYIRKENNILCTNFAHLNPFLEDKNYWLDEARKIISKEFDTKPDNIFVISQPDFHIDMAIRPLKYPYVLINSKNITNNFINKYFKNSSFDTNYQNMLRQKARIKYEDEDEIAKELEKYGFKPIKIGGIYGKDINFMNAIVHERPNGKLAYITNSSDDERKSSEVFQNNFAKEIEEKCPEIEKIYFVKGGIGKNGRNGIMSILNDLSGGIHCMVTEDIK